MGILSILSEVDFFEKNGELIIAKGVELNGKENELCEEWQRILQDNNIYR